MKDIPSLHDTFILLCQGTLIHASTFLVSFFFYMFIFQIRGFLSVFDDMLLLSYFLSNECTNNFILSLFMIVQRILQVVSGYQLASALIVHCNHRDFLVTLLSSRQTTNRYRRSLVLIDSRIFPIN